jgi:hypothetical protein
MEISDANVWRKCSSCKKPIGFNSRYYVCSVSTCNSQRSGYVFCSVPCFEVHVPGARHKDAAAIENKSPSREPARTIVRPAGSVPTSTASHVSPKEVLIIASRLKDYIFAKAEMNTSSQVMDILSDHVRVLCERAIDNARADGRKTVLDRDFAFLKRS